MNTYYISYNVIKHDFRARVTPVVAMSHKTYDMTDLFDESEHVDNAVEEGTLGILNEKEFHRISRGVL